MDKNSDFIQRLKEANPIEEVISSYCKTEKKGRLYWCSCPFHGGDDTPSLAIYPDENRFFCYGCHKGGDVINFVQEISGLDFKETITELARRSGLQMPVYSKKEQLLSKKKEVIYELNRLSANFFYKNLYSRENTAGAEYLTRRGIRAETAKKYGLGYAPDSWNLLTDYLLSKGYSEEEITSAWLSAKSEKNGRLYDIFRDRIMFPIVDLNGKVIGFGGRALKDTERAKYLNTATTPVFEKGTNLYSMNFVKKSGMKNVILCEGYMDVIAVNQAGFENATATLGTAITPQQAKLISRFAGEVIIAYDNDSAGQQAVRKAVRYLSEYDVFSKVLVVKGAKDPDEFIKKYGSENFGKLLEESEDAVVHMLRQCEDEIDMSSEYGKINYLRKVSEIIADIKSPVARDVYISSCADRCGIPSHTLRDSVNARVESVRKSDRPVRTENYGVTGFDNREYQGDYPDVDLEEMIISFLISNPSSVSEVERESPPANFTDPFNRKVYTAIVDRIKKFGNFSLSLLADEFSPAELGRISGIETKKCERQTFLHCAEMLRKRNLYSADGKNADISNEQLRSLFDSKSGKKGKL